MKSRTATSLISSLHNISFNHPLVGSLPHKILIMTEQRLLTAARITGFPGGMSSVLLEEALDVTKHLPLAMVGDKVLDLLIAVAYYEAGFSNGQCLQQPQS